MVQKSPPLMIELIFIIYDASISGPTRIHPDYPQQVNPDIPTDVSHDINNSFLNFQPDDDDKFDCFKSRGLHFFHLNTQSLFPKLSEVKILANKTRASVIAISETWYATITDSEIELEGFNVIRNDQSRNGGGVCIYIKNYIAFNVRMDLCDDHIESMWAEILLP